jgi:hypothetical protein
LYRVHKWRGEYSGEEHQRIENVQDASEAQLVSSEVLYAPGYHTIMLDIDYNCAVVSSSTEGHHHLYIDKLLEWSAYREILEVLAKHGVIEEEYKNMSLRDGATYLRVPWNKKVKVA